MKKLTIFLPISLLLTACDQQQRTHSASEIEEALKKKGMQIVDGTLVDSEMAAGESLMEALRNSGLNEDGKTLEFSQAKLLTDDNSIAMVVYGLRHDETDELRKSLKDVLNKHRLDSIEIIDEYIIERKDGSLRMAYKSNRYINTEETLPGVEKLDEYYDSGMRSWNTR